MGETTTTQSQTSTQQPSVTTTASAGSQAVYIIQNIGISLILLIILVVVWKIARRGFEVLYDIFNAHRMVYLKVLLPRGDTKSEREKEKELAKDMKEKI